MANESIIATVEVHLGSGEKVFAGEVDLANSIGADFKRELITNGDFPEGQPKFSDMCLLYEDAVVKDSPLLLTSLPRQDAISLLLMLSKGPPREGLQVWLDASDLESVTTEDEKVTAWSDRSGHGHHAANSSQNGPTCDASSSLNGLPALAFTKGQTLQAATSCTVKTVALVMQLHTVSDCLMLFAQKDADFSVRMTDGDKGFIRERSAKHSHCGRGGDGNDWCHGQPEKLWLNGDNTSSTWEGFPHAPVVIVAVKRSGRVDGADFVYQLSSKFHNRGFTGLLGEVLVYEHELQNEEIEQLQTYLTEKWMDGRTSAAKEQ